MDFVALKSPQPPPLRLRLRAGNSSGDARRFLFPSLSISCWLSPSVSHPKLGLIVAAAARKGSKDVNPRKKKEDGHSFVSRPDEATGPFPEAVLLKQRKVEEDGKLMPEFADVEERELFEALSLQLESDMDSERTRHYEVVYLIHENCKEEVENVSSKVQGFVREKKGRIWRLSDWGMRKLAYKIRKAKKAHYLLMNFELEAKWINEFKSLLDQDERIIRHLVMKRDKAETKECPPPPEFHTLRDGMNDDDDDDDEEEDEDLEDEDWGDDEAGGVIYVDDVDDEGRESSTSSSDKHSKIMV